MNGRLFRFTPHGGKPNHYTDSLASALALHDNVPADRMRRLEVGEFLDYVEGTWERVA